jgi:hypothetical protein
MNAPRYGESVERVAAQVDRLCWSGVLLGLAFTMTNVQQFAANGAPSWSVPWCTAWLLDPMVSLVLLAILRAEQVTARYGVRTGGWVRAAKWFTLSATYVMNTWEAFTAASPARVVLHSVPPLVVFVAAEAVTDLRDKLGAAVSAARLAESRPTAGAEFMNTAQRSRPEAARLAPASRVDVAPVDVTPGDTTSDNGTADNVASGHEVQQRRPRISFAEYLRIAQEAWTPGVNVTPAWVREVTGCSRGLSSRLAATLNNPGGG